MDVKIIPILSDNYAYVIQSGEAVAVIDPGEAKPILQYLKDNGLSLDWVINTHHHGDHVDGNKDILKAFPDAKLAAPDECGGKPDIVLKDGEPFDFGEVSFEIKLTSGHTMGHVVLYEPTYRILFAGDTLFAMGCGRVFEGSMEDMYNSMQIVKELPPETAIYCGHEYTLSNAKFAKYILPTNMAIFERYSGIEEGQCTMPTTMACELKTNPFLLANDLNEFIKFRHAKDNF